MDKWTEAQKHEAEYWQNCLGMTAWGEFTKQEMYGREMGLFSEYGTPDGELDMQGKSVLDIGGGPVSMTLRCINAGILTVADPCPWPPSVHRRYKNYGIEFIQARGEDLLGQHFRVPEAKGVYDEVWVYNVLQHVQDPAQVLTAAKTLGKVLRIFEWLWIPADKCHPHVLSPEGILNWLEGCRIKKIGLPHLKEFWSDATALAGVFTC